MVIALDEAQGGAIPESVVIPAAAEIGEHLADRLKDAGMEVDNAFLQRGTVYMMQNLSEYYGVDEDQMREFASSFTPESMQAYHDEEASFFKGHGLPEGEPQQQGAMQGGMTAGAPAPAPQGLGSMGRS